MPRELQITIYEIPEFEFLFLAEKDLPGNWKEIPSPQSTKDFGFNYFKDPELLGICVPSTIVPEEFNYLINPTSHKLNAVKVVGSKEFLFDIRIKS